MSTAVAVKTNVEGKGMYYSELCNELDKFIRGELSLSIIQDCFSRYWKRVRNNGSENEDIIAKVEMLQIAVDAYGSGHFLKEDLWHVIHQHTSEIDHCQYK
ncbi:MAG: hypothetical protein ACFFCD_04400 [Promethearchaeota archaeon]